MRVLYAGDSPAGGAANYLLALLKRVGANVQHVPPTELLRPQRLTRRVDAILLSDFSAAHVPLATQRLIVQQVRSGAGFCMIGGWASFAAPQGGWKGSLLETLLPIRCLAHDDRRAFPAGALLVPGQAHPLISRKVFRKPPAVCGLNAVRVVPESVVLLRAQPIVGALKQSSNVSTVHLSRTTYPLLVIHADPAQRLMALTTDLAPHWCGGLVDWGATRLTLPVARHHRVEVGSAYCEFVASLLRWLTRR